MIAIGVVVWPVVVSYSAPPPYIPALQFNDARNSMYLSLILEDF